MCLHELGLYFSFISCFFLRYFFSFLCKKKMRKLVLKFSQLKQTFLETFRWNRMDRRVPISKNQAWSIIMGKNIAS